jgi:hypothetical protein
MSDGKNWQDMIAAERMQVDQGFEEHLTASPLTRQQWGLVMTAVEFEIDGPEDPSEATLVANTSKLSSVMGEIKNMGERSSAMGGPAAGSGASSSSGGLFDGIKSALGFGSGTSALQEAAEELSQEYAEQLQAHLEKRGRWQLICQRAAEGQAE